MESKAVGRGRGERRGVRTEKVRRGSLCSGSLSSSSVVGAIQYLRRDSNGFQKAMGKGEKRARKVAR